MWKVLSKVKKPDMAIHLRFEQQRKVCVSLSSPKSCISSLEGGKRIYVTLVSKKNCWTILLPHQLGTDSSEGTDLETEQ